MPGSLHYSATFVLGFLVVLYTYNNVADGFTTKGQWGPQLLYSTTKDLRIVNSSRTASKAKPNTLVRNLTQGTAIDFHYALQKLCWTDHSNESIQCASFNGHTAENKEEVISNGLMSPDGLACDWYTNKLYWTDGEANRIEVATMSGHNRKVLFWSDIDQPRAIALAPKKGLLFWTDWGDVAKIERAGMNGDPATRKVIVIDDIFWPNGLTIDYENEIIYWLDARLLFIEKMNFDGSNRQPVVNKHLSYPYSLTYFQNKLYWTDWKTWAIYTVDSNSSASNSSSAMPKELMHSDAIPNAIHVWDPKRQPVGNHSCQKNNGGCSHLCLLAPYEPGHTCACPMGIKLLDDHKCADKPQEILILALRTSIYVIYLDSPDYSYRVVPVTGIKHTIAVDYDPVEDYIYWTDDIVKKIQRAKLNGSQQEDVIVPEVQHPDGIAVDWVARNLYWTDTGTDRIEVARLDGKYRKVLINEDLYEPRAIALAPDHGWMFWSDWYEDQPKIERANLDGSRRVKIIWSDLGWPNGVTLDLERSKIYWSDAKTDKIEFADMDGSNRIELISDNLPHIFGFSILGDYLYWTDWQRRAIDRVHKESGENREVIIDQLANMMGLKATRLTAVEGKNECGKNNGGCSHICLNRHNDTYICACQIGYELIKDRHTCVIPAAFLLFSKRDGIGRISIENENNNMTIPVTGVKNASSIDFDSTNNRIYWSDLKLKSIMRAFINGSDTQRVIELGLSSPEGIAVDWIAQNLYWTDSNVNRIEVARLDGTSRRTLLWTDVDKPHSIALDPNEGYIYWSEWGRANCIKRAAMDGSHPYTLVENSGEVSSLLVDYDKKRLYWAELSTDSILSSDLSGYVKKTLINAELERPSGLTLYQDYIYWSDETLGTISRALKINGNNRTVVHVLEESATDLMVYHKLSQRGTNQCAVNNGGCSHLCLALPNNGIQDGNSKTHTCACPTHFSPHNNTCIPPQRFMIYSQRNLVVRLLPDTADCPEAVLPIQGLRTIKAIDFDPVHHYLYWIEGKTRSIKRAEENGLDINVVLAGNQNNEPFDIALDSLGRLLFWTCATQNVINVTRLDNRSTVGVVIKNEGEKPRLLAIHPTKRLLFYTDVGNTPQLKRTRMDGSHRIIIAMGENIAAIAIDAENDMIVWAQGHSIYMSNIDGENHHVVLNESNSHITQLTVHSGWLYWLDKEIQQVQRLELKTGKSRSAILDHISNNIIDLVSVYQPNRNHSCAQPKRCSHLCIGNDTHLLCSCPHGLLLQEDRKTCAAVPDCGPEHFTCATYLPSKDCIPVAWKCDGQRDCPDGSDEAACPTCRNDQFRCQSGQCIEKSWLCDGTPQCPEGDDEAKCCKSAHEFQCPRTEVCISGSLLCDGTENCADGADELEAVCRGTIQPKSNTYTIFIIIIVVLVLTAFVFLMYYVIRKHMNGSEMALNDQAEDPLSPAPSRTLIKPLSQNKMRHKGIPDIVHMSMLNGSQSSGYGRSHITGASSSTNGSSLACYPRETLNPPPSPATTAASTRGSSPSMRYRPYRHYRSINQPPPPTPCSTDVCDESDCNYPSRSHYDGGSIPPPPTPRSHCHSESCPPSPSSRSSTYFNPLPPPPSPVPSPPRGYDS